MRPILIWYPWFRSTHAPRRSTVTISSRWNLWPIVEWHSFLRSLGWLRKHKLYNSNSEFVIDRMGQPRISSARVWRCCELVEFVYRPGMIIWRCCSCLSWWLPIGSVIGSRWWRELWKRRSRWRTWLWGFDLCCLVDNHLVGSKCSRGSRLASQHTRWRKHIVTRGRLSLILAQTAPFIWIKARKESCKQWWTWSKWRWTVKRCRCPCTRRRMN